MQVYGYSAEELKLFHSVIDEAASEMIALGREIPGHVMMDRLFAAASRGERDLERLKSAVMGSVIWPAAGSFSSVSATSSSVVYYPPRS